MIEGNYEIFQQIGYVASAILFIFGLKMLGKEETAVREILYLLLACYWQ